MKTIYEVRTHIDDYTPFEGKPSHTEIEDSQFFDNHKAAMDFFNDMKQMVCCEYSDWIEDDENNRDDMFFMYKDGEITSHLSITIVKHPLFSTNEEYDEWDGDITNLPE